MTDFEFRYHGSICLLIPLTNEGVDWADENLPEDAQHFGGGIVIEPRFADDILTGLEADGLTVTS